MIGSPKLFRVWNQLQDIPMKWVDVMEISKLANLTFRQVSALLTMMPEGLIEKRRDPVTKDQQVRLCIPPEEVPAMDIYMREICYKVDDESLQKVQSALDSEEWRSLQSLCEATGLDRHTIGHVLSHLPNVEIKYSGRITIYRKGC